MRHLAIEGVQLFLQLLAVLVRTADHKQAVGQAADHPFRRAVKVLLPLVCHKADQLAHHHRAIPGPQGVGVVQRHQRQRGAAVLVGPLIQAGAELRLKIAAVEHTRQEIVVHILAAELALPRGHPVFRQAAACQRCCHLQLPDFALDKDLAPQHAAYLPVAQLVVHHEAVVLPITAAVFIQLRQGHVLKSELRVLHKPLQVLLRTFFLHAFFPIIRAPLSPLRHALPPGPRSCLPRFKVIIAFSGNTYQQNP